MGIYSRAALLEAIENGEVTANLAKFTQNPAFAEWLVATAPKVLVEASLWDRIWGKVKTIS